MLFAYSSTYTVRHTLYVVHCTLYGVQQTIQYGIRSEIHVILARLYIYVGYGWSLPQWVVFSGVWSVGSVVSVDSVGSVGSVVSVGSVGSV